MLSIYAGDRGGVRYPEWSSVSPASYPE